jgi:antitoxin (DNA-binding transcriptional repressor) of toxin-antitoxin stability system
VHETRSVTEIARHFADYINRVAYRGERFVLVRGSKPVAELGPLPAGRRLAELPGLLGSLPRLSETEAKEFTADLASAKATLDAVEVRDPWAS